MKNTAYRTSEKFNSSGMSQTKYTGTTEVARNAMAIGNAIQFDFVAAKMNR
jgi:hypothetical protein